MNAPSTSHWAYRRLVEQPEDGWTLYRQPGGFDPAAENLGNLRDGRGYYERLAQGKPLWWTRRYVTNHWTFARDGQPVWPEFSEDLHIAKAPLLFVPAWPLVVAVDGGRTPCALARQTAPSGQRRYLSELVTDGAGATTFGRSLKRWLAAEFPGARVRGVADPATQWAAKDDANERSWLQIVQAESGVPFRPAPGNNELSVRLEAVRTELTRLIDGEPELMVSPHCRTLIKAMLSEYRYRKVNGTNQYSDHPEKLHPWSDIADCAQYDCLFDGGYLETLGRSPKGRAPVVADHSFVVM